ncbi:MAG: cytochrome c [Novosphingobium sp.]|nr:cytochrome c [Novosphingobium sp.]
MKAAILAIVLASGLATACATTATPPSSPAERGLAFARERCAGCHGVAANAPSPGPDAPPFDDIANRPGVTEETMRAFLRDSHNYPAVMNFELDAARMEELSAWMMSLRREGYSPTR